MYKLVNGKKRIFYLDEIRALAIMLVLLAHVFRGFTDNLAIGSWQWCFSTVWVDFAVMGVPLFLMISGCLLLNRDYELGSFLKHRFARILIPFIPWSLLLALLLMYTQYEVSLASYIHIFLDEQCWFIWMLIGVYLFLPVINAFVKEFKIKGVEYFLVIWLITMVLGFFKMYPFHNLELSYFAGYLGYFVMGYYLANKEFNISDKNMIRIGFLIFVVSTLFHIYFTLRGGLVRGVLRWATYMTIVPVIQASGLFLLFRYWAIYSSKNPGSFRSRIYSIFKDSFLFKIIFAISTYSYGMFLVHYFPLNILKYISKHYVNFFTWNPVIWLPIMYVVVFTAAFLIVYIVGHIPYLKQFSGAH